METDWNPVVQAVELGLDGVRSRAENSFEKKDFVSDLDICSLLLRPEKNGGASVCCWEAGLLHSMVPIVVSRAATVA